jgi:hypothetical protein
MLAVLFKPRPSPMRSTANSMLPFSWEHGCGHTSSRTRPSFRTSRPLPCCMCSTSNFDVGFGSTQAGSKTVQLGMSIRFPLRPKTRHLARCLDHTAELGTPTPTRQSAGSCRAGVRSIRRVAHDRRERSCLGMEVNIPHTRIDARPDVRPLAAMATSDRA